MRGPVPAVAALREPLTSHLWWETFGCRPGGERAPTHPPGQGGPAARSGLPTLGHLLPTVQNCPNLFCEATRSPLSSVVTLVSAFSWPSTVANTGVGTPGRGAERGTLG